MPGPPTLSIVSSWGRPGVASTIIPEAVSGFPAGGVIPGDEFLSIVAGELVLATRLDFPCAALGVLGPPLPTERGPVTGEGALMYGLLLPGFALLEEEEWPATGEALAGEFMDAELLLLFPGDVLAVGGAGEETSVV